MSVNKLSMFVLIINNENGDYAKSQVFFYPNTDAGEESAKSDTQSKFKELSDKTYGRPDWVTATLVLFANIADVFLDTSYNGVLDWSYASIDNPESDAQDVLYLTYEDIDEDIDEDEDDDEVLNPEDVVRPTEDGRYYIALNYANLDHRQNEQEVISRFMAHRVCDMKVSLSNDKDQHIIVISEIHIDLLDLLDELDVETIVWDDTLAAEYLG